jgi:hypothetical protein
MEQKVLDGIKRRSITFSMVLSVMLAAASIVAMTSASRETQCQARADHLEIPILVIPQLDNNKSFYTVTLTALKELELNVRFKKMNKTTIKEITALDSRHQLASRGYRLVREVIDGLGGQHQTVTWALRYISTKLCGTQPPAPMDALNSDYETSSRRVVATMPNGTRYFVRETSLSSSQTENRIHSFDDFQNCFPGFRSISTAADGVWDRMETFTVETISMRPVVNARDVPVFHLNVESWSQSGRLLLWKVTVRCPNPAQQDLALSAANLLRAKYTDSKMIFTGLRPSDFFEWSGVA